MKHLIIFLTFIFIGCSFAKAQNAKTDITIKEQNIEGTYQIQVINSRNQPYIPENLKQLVIDNRQETTVNYIRLGTEVRLMILPVSEITKKDFKPLQKIGYVAE